MVYINSRGEVVDDNRASPANFFWRFITFIILFFKSLAGIEDHPNSKKDDNIGGSGPVSGRNNGGGGGGRPGGGGGGRPSNDDKRPKGFGPRGFKSITDLPPTPSPCAGGACGI